MTNKAYDILKYIAQIALPALGTLYFALAGIWNFTCTVNCSYAGKHVISSFLEQAILHTLPKQAQIATLYRQHFLQGAFPCLPHMVFHGARPA